MEILSIEDSLIVANLRRKYLEINSKIKEILKNNKIIIKISLRISFPEIEEKIPIYIVANIAMFECVLKEFKSSVIKGLYLICKKA